MPLFKKSFLSFPFFKRSKKIPTLKKLFAFFDKALSQYQRRKNHLTKSEREEIHQRLSSMQEALLEKNRKQASLIKETLEPLIEARLKKPSLITFLESIGSLALILVLALLIRQMWFEFYEIPTGSMRPTFKEKDRLVVSKDQFGINIPFKKGHLLSQKEDIKRNGIVIFTGKDLPIDNVETKYFYLFKGPKQFIKRLIGKPGDTLYFYGGQIYGVDKKRRSLFNKLNPPLLSSIEHIPFIRFEGKVHTPPIPSHGVYSPITLYQMNKPVAKMWSASLHHVRGELLDEKNGNYFDLWGFKNYAMVRLVKGENNLPINTLEKAPFYLEIHHHPTLQGAKIGYDPFSHKRRPILGVSSSFIPLKEDEMKTLFSLLTTARFKVEKGYARRFDAPSSQPSFLPYLGKEVPDGYYEFFNGKGYQISYQGISHPLDKNHPLMQFQSERCYHLFNLGTLFHTYIHPKKGRLSPFPSRYAYFRNGDLFVMGGVLLKKDSPLLSRFLQKEYEKQSSDSSYFPFEDLGPPSIDTILIHGFKVPKNRYLLLGDNHAMSADSREFGCVPNENLQGIPLALLWPPGERWGYPLQPPYSVLTLSRRIIWIAALLIITCAVWINRKNKKRKLFSDIPL